MAAPLALRLEDYDYALPVSQIAQHAPAERDAGRMLRLNRENGASRDAWVRALPAYLRAGDILIFNDSRVFPARLFGYRSGARADPRPSRRNPAAQEYLRGQIEVLLIRRLDERTWEALARPGRKLGIGERIQFTPPDSAGAASSIKPNAAGHQAAPLLAAEIVGRGERGLRRLRFEWEGDFDAQLNRLGSVPLPPYIARPVEAEDRERYQTVFARNTGSAAAPTAGLHFTPDLLARLALAGVECRFLSLDVGLGTFQPLQAGQLASGKLHAERYCIPEDTAAALRQARRERRRIVAVGTTVVRALESSARRHAGEVRAESAETELFLSPGDEFLAIDGLLTNFHLPRSSLLLLVCAFAGREPTLAAYRHAVDAGYRFFSYGDCMLILAGEP